GMAATTAPIAKAASCRVKRAVHEPPWAAGKRHVFMRVCTGSGVGLTYVNVSNRLVLSRNGIFLQAANRNPRLGRKTRGNAQANETLPTQLKHLGRPPHDECQRINWSP